MYIIRIVLCDIIVTIRGVRDIGIPSSDARGVVIMIRLIQTKSVLAIDYRGGFI